MFETVVIASDLSPASERVIRCAEDWKPFGLREVVVAHVHNIRHTGGLEPALRADHEPKLEAQAQVLRAAGLAASWRLEFGVPYLDMNRIAADAGADVVVIGSHGKTWIAEVLLGSIADAMLRHSIVPVLVIKVNRLRDLPLAQCGSACGGMFGELLLASDFSEASEPATAAVVEAARRVRGVVHVTHVVEASRALPLEQHLLDEHRSEAQQRLGALVERLREAGASGVTSSVRTDHPVTGILTEIEIHQPTMVVVGTHGRGHLAGMLLGSVAHELARRSPMPVLVVPRGWKPTPRAGSRR
jgi:nucleotide-binding universal stress UspA family protein